MVKVVGIVGTIASGKEVLKEVLQKNYSNYSVRLSEVIRAEMEKKRKDFDRKMLQDLGNEMRQKYGGGILAKMAVEYLPRDKQLIIIDGIRNAGEIDYLKKTFGKKFVLFAVDAPREIRWQRVLLRQRSADPKNFEEFVEMDDRDHGVGESAFGQQTKTCMNRADFVFENVGTIDDFKKTVEEKVKELL